MTRAKSEPWEESGIRSKELSAACSSFGSKFSVWRRKCQSTSEEQLVLGCL